MNLSGEKADLSARPDLILLHGWSWQPAIWDPVREKLPRTLAVTTPALPGHGNDAAAAGQSACVHREDWLPALFDPARVDGAVLAGWSLGGLLALAAVAKGLVRPRALVLIGALPRFVAVPGEAGIDPGAIDDMAAGIRAGNAQLVLRRFDALLRRGRRMEPDERARIAAWRADSECTAEALLQGLHWLRETDLTNALSSMAIPVSLWLGEQDPLCPAHRGLAFEPLPVVSVEVLAGQGHWLPLTAAGAIAENLQRVCAATGPDSRP
ncbi:MAG: alpha/beta fold hydrolase [Halothiobacillaceae bacterium]